MNANHLIPIITNNITYTIMKIRFDKTKTIELVVGIIAVYAIYFKTGLLQESV